MRNKKIELEWWVLFLSFFVLLGFIVSSLYWQDIALIHYPKFLILSVIIISLLDSSEILGYIKACTYYVFFNIILAVLGFIYALFGGASVFEVVVPTTGRAFDFYLTSFSVTNYADFIRPSGFFDEPGALSFFVCFIVMLRELNGLNRNISIVMLLLGLVTLSLAHVLFFIIFFVYIFMLERSFKYGLSIVIFLAWLAVFFVFIPNGDVVLEYFLSRSSSDIGSEGRSGLLFSALDMISKSEPSVYLFGINSKCLTDYMQGCQSIYPRMGENILSPLVFGGFLTSWIYYFMFGLVMLVFFVRPNLGFVLLSFGVLFIQRPYHFNVSYSLTFAFLLTSSLNILLRKNSEQLKV